MRESGFKGYQPMKHPERVKKVGEILPGTPETFLHKSVLESVRRYLSSENPTLERGGLIYGTIGRESADGEPFAIGKEFVPTRTAPKIYPGNHCILPSEFTQADEATESKGEGEKRIGWVTSHPNQDPKPSPRDRKLMQEFFQRTPEQFTVIVTDTDQVDVFRWQYGEAVNQGGYYIVKP